MSVVVNGSPVSVDVIGSGEPLLFVHGFPLDRRMWQAQLPAFVETHRVIVPDLRGFGESRAAATSMTMEECADDLADLLDALEIAEPVNLCGLSMGGYVAFAFYRRHRSRVKRLILCDTKSTADPSQKKADRERMATDVLKSGTEEIARDMPQSLLAAGTFTDRPEVVDMISSMIAQARPAAIAAALRGMAGRCDSTEMLQDIDVPTLVVVGAEDGISPPAEMRDMSSRIPHSRFAVIPAAAHLVPLENPQAFNTVLQDFLASPLTLGDRHA